MHPKIDVNAPCWHTYPVVSLMCMVIEVFKTNVVDGKTASMLLALIHSNFSHCTANFDLHDCDNILRVASLHKIDPSLLISLLDAHGFQAEVLPG